MGEWAKEEEQLQLPPRVFGHSLRAAAFNKIIQFGYEKVQSRLEKIKFAMWLGRRTRVFIFKPSGELKFERFVLKEIYGMKVKVVKIEKKRKLLSKNY